MPILELKQPFLFWSLFCFFAILVKWTFCNWGLILIKLDMFLMGWDLYTQNGYEIKSKTPHWITKSGYGTPFPTTICPLWSFANQKLYPIYSKSALEPYFVGSHACISKHSELNGFSFRSCVYKNNPHHEKMPKKNICILN